MSIRFAVSLITAPNNEEIRSNCTRIGNCLHDEFVDWWIFEGDREALSTRNLVIHEEGVVGALGGLSQRELIEICEKAFPGTFDALAVGP